MVHWPYRLIDPRRRKKMIGPWSNVIFIKEMRTKAMGKMHYLVRGVYSCLGLSIALIFVMSLMITRSSFAVDTYRVVILCFQLALVLLLTPSLSASAITSEIEGGHIDQLRSAHIGGFTMIMGKFMAAMLPMVILLVATLPIMAALGAIAGEINCILKGLAVIGVTTLFAACTGLFFSSFMRRTAGAVAASYIMVLVFGVGTFAVHFLADNLSPKVVENLLSVNAIAAGISAISSTSLTEYHLFSKYLMITGGLTVAMFVAAAVRVGILLRVER
jgi:ABC-type transport system involved in multi-copper enzyme maturation permease subunit